MVEKLEPRPGLEPGTCRLRKSGLPFLCVPSRFFPFRLMSLTFQYMAVFSGLRL